MANIAKLRRLN